MARTPSEAADASNGHGGTAAAVHTPAMTSDLRSVRRRAASLAAVLLVGMVSAAGAYEEGFERCGLVDERISEASGIARSPGGLPDLVWTHNDSGHGPVVYAVSLVDCATVATLRLDGASATDWEDVASGPSPSDGSPALFLGDVGDNVEDGRSRDELAVHVVAEPSTEDLRPGAMLTATPATYRFVWPDTFHDVETLLLNPATGDVLLVTKEIAGGASVWRAAMPATPPAEAVTLERVASLGLRAPSPPNPTAGGPLGSLGFHIATGGDVSADGTLVAVRTYEDLLEWDVVDGDVIGAFATTPRRVDLPTSSQGEALAYLPDGSLVATSEGVSAAVHVLAVSAQTLPTEASDPVDEPSPVVASEPAGSQSVPADASSRLVILAAAALIGGVIALVVRRKR